MAEILEKALLDTIIGMGVVFTMLILIAFIIWSFKFIYQYEQRAAKNKQQSVPVPISVPAPVAQASVVEEEEELTDDLELVAVITAAIYASIGDNVPVNGLVVKSIKKANKAAWQRA